MVVARSNCSGNERPSNRSEIVIVSCNYRVRRRQLNPRRTLEVVLLLENWIIRHTSISDVFNLMTLKVCHVLQWKRTTVDEFSDQVLSRYFSPVTDL